VVYIPSQEAVFKMKSMFDPKDELAQWILKIAMSRNDFLYVHNRLLELNDNGSNHSGESLYFFRLACSHYREAVYFLSKYKNKRNVLRFLSRMDKEFIEDYETLIDSCEPWKGSFVERVMLPIRNNLFHYSTDNFDEIYSEFEDFFSRVIITGKTRSHIDLVFADELAIKLSLGEIEQEEFKELLTYISRLFVSFIRFTDHAINMYLISRKINLSYQVIDHRGINHD
jgi:hypothetical protein